MLIFVIGGSASGKSEYAENLCVKLAGTDRKIYLATMEPFGEEAKERMERHHRLRAKKGFDTVEQYRNLWELEGLQTNTILLECMSTLLANEFFGTSNNHMTYMESMEKGMQTLKAGSQHLVLVSNHIFQDGVEYSRETMDYIIALGEVNRKLAKEADVVIEVVCGIPVIHKGQEKLYE